MVQLIIPDGVKLLKRRHPVGTSLVWSVILTGALITCSLLIFLALRGFDCHLASRGRKTAITGQIQIVQGLKPASIHLFTARLKSCPDTKHS
jgi:hypothetical protein